MYDDRRGGSVFGAFLLGGLIGAVLDHETLGRAIRVVCEEPAEDVDVDVVSRCRHEREQERREDAGERQAGIDGRACRIFL